MVFKFILLLFLPFVSVTIHKLYLVEVDPADFVCQHQKQIKGDPKSLFDFLTTPLGMEKLIPWLSRFKEADKRIIGLGKSYKATFTNTVLGEKRVYAKLTEYNPSKLLAFEFDDITKQNIVIQTRSYHDRTLLQVTVYSRRSSMLYQYTIGYVMRQAMKDQLVSSMKNFAALYESLDGPHKIPNFSKSET